MMKQTYDTEFTRAVDNFNAYPQPIHIFPWLIHILNLVFTSVRMLQFFYIKQTQI